MASLVIPVQSYPETNFKIDLDGEPYRIRVYWLAYDTVGQQVIGSAGKWLLDLVGENNGLQILSIGLTVGVNLLEPFGHRELGGLVLADTEGKLQDPGFNGFGARWKLIYVGVDDLPAFESGLEKMTMELSR